MNHKHILISLIAILCFTCALIIPRIVISQIQADQLTSLALAEQSKADAEKAKLEKEKTTAELEIAKLNADRARSEADTNKLLAEKARLETEAAAEYRKAEELKIAFEEKKKEELRLEAEENARLDRIKNEELRVAAKENQKRIEQQKIEMLKNARERAGVITSNNARDRELISQGFSKVYGILLGTNISDYKRFRLLGKKEKSKIAYYVHPDSPQFGSMVKYFNEGTIGYTETIYGFNTVNLKQVLIVDESNGEIIGTGFIGPENRAIEVYKQLKSITGQRELTSDYRSIQYVANPIYTRGYLTYIARAFADNNLVVHFSSTQDEDGTDFLVSFYEPKRYIQASNNEN